MKRAFHSVIFVLIIIVGLSLFFVFSAPSPATGGALDRTTMKASADTYLAFGIVYYEAENSDRGVFELVARDASDVEDSRLVVNLDTNSALITYTGLDGQPVELVVDRVLPMNADDPVVLRGKLNGLPFVAEKEGESFKLVTDQADLPNDPMLASWIEPLWELSPSWLVSILSELRATKRLSPQMTSVNGCWSPVLHQAIPASLMYPGMTRRPLPAARGPLAAGCVAECHAPQLMVSASARHTPARTTITMAPVNLVMIYLPV